MFIRFGIFANDEPDSHYLLNGVRFTAADVGKTFLFTPDDTNGAAFPAYHHQRRR